MTTKISEFTYDDNLRKYGERYKDIPQTYKIVEGVDIYDTLEKSLHEILSRVNKLNREKVSIESIAESINYRFKKAMDSIGRGSIEVYSWFLIREYFFINYLEKHLGGRK